eukprot:TRINITY_DN9384_c0_g1_i7.p7 TRINITY_DN9384_c0_g1~~TRINITY_DN9384_c0_g1_i7.p7  ORF type:complete len:188 (+),score=-9.43 TRINITY_DN9384_c0_g1_i7:2035-2598(+)
MIYPAMWLFFVEKRQKYLEHNSELFQIADIFQKFRDLCVKCSQNGACIRFFFMRLLRVQKNLNKLQNFQQPKYYSTQNHMFQIQFAFFNILFVMLLRQDFLTTIFYILTVMYYKRNFLYASYMVEFGQNVVDEVVKKLLCCLHCSCCSKKNNQKSLMLGTNTRIFGQQYLYQKNIYNTYFIFSFEHI